MNILSVDIALLSPLMALLTDDFSELGFVVRTSGC